MTERDYEVLSEYEEDFMSRVVLPSLASRERAEIMQMAHNPFSLTDAHSRVAFPWSTRKRGIPCIPKVPADDGNRARVPGLEKASSSL